MTDCDDGQLTASEAIPPWLQPIGTLKRGDVLRGSKELTPVRYDCRQILRITQQFRLRTGSPACRLSCSYCALIQIQILCGHSIDRKSFGSVPPAGIR